MLQTRPWYVRLTSGIVGATLLVVATVFTLGTCLAAPLGMLAIRWWARRRGGIPTRLTSWIGAWVASSVAVLAIMVFALRMAPGNALSDIQKAATEAQTAPVTPLPKWMTRAFPKTAEPDPVTQRVVQSPTFVVVTLIYGAVLGAMLLGIIVGSAGWISVTMLRYAFRRAPTLDAPQPAS